MGGAGSQRKGRHAEIELAQILQSYGYQAEPGRALNYGQEPDVKGLPGIHLEAKRHERLQLMEWIRQAEEDAQRMGDGLPAVVFRQNRQPWRIVLRLEDFLQLYTPQTTTEPTPPPAGRVR